MRNLDFRRWRPRQAQRERSDRDDLLRAHDRIDIELRHSFDPHFITETCPQNDCGGMIAHGSAVMVVMVRLLPNAAVFEPNHRVAFEAVDIAVDSTNESIGELAARTNGVAVRFLSRFLA